MHDPYIISNSTIKEPPKTFAGKLAFLGPGFILSASIVGSGELIATTILGAQAGFAALWIIIVSCLAKVAVQLEFGKHAVLTGESAMVAFNKLPGPMIGKGRWTVWTVMVLMLLKIVQIGGILGGTAIVLGLLLPQLSITTWAVITAAAGGLLIYNGRYNLVEKVSLVMIALFTVLTLTSLISLRNTSFGFSWNDIANGMSFNLSGAVVGIAIGAFGITGVGSDEVIAYNYWCIEKGYAKFTGPRVDDEQWRKRAAGWINVMYVDALFAMLIYTLVTVAFYLLGAAVLHKRGDIPQGTEVIETLALIYTRTLGPGIRTTYLVGAFFVLFSSLYASLAAWTRLYSDGMGQLGWIDFFDVTHRRKMIAILAWTFPALWLLAYLFIQLPVLMVLSGGVVGSVLLLLVVFAAIQYKFTRTNAIPSGVIYNLAFWISVVSILGIAVYGIARIV